MPKHFHIAVPNTHFDTIFVNLWMTFLQVFSLFLHLYVVYFDKESFGVGKNEFQPATSYFEQKEQNYFCYGPFATTEYLDTTGRCTKGQQRGCVKN